MEQYFTFGIILLIALGSTWQYVRQKTLSQRVIVADYSLKQLHFPVKWTKFILPALILVAGLYGDISVFLVLTAALLSVSTIVEWLLNSKYEYKPFIIQGNILIMNEYKIKEFNLEQLAGIVFLPFVDSLKLKFMDGKSLSIHRPDFQKEYLTTFLSIAIGKTNCL